MMFSITGNFGKKCPKTEFSFFTKMESFLFPQKEICNDFCSFSKSLYLHFFFVKKKKDKQEKRRNSQKKWKRF